MTVNSTWKEWEPEELILDERASNWIRFIDNFIMEGFGLVDGGGLFLDVGQVGDNFAYINGFEIEQTGTQAILLTANSTNHVYLTYTETADPDGPASSVLSITITLVVNTTGVAPSVNSMKLGEADTDGGSILVIRAEPNLFQIKHGQLQDDLDADQKEIKNQVIHLGTAFPTSPVEGQFFFRTDLNAPHTFNGATWDNLISAAVPVLGHAKINNTGSTILLGRVVRQSATVGDEIELADASLESLGASTIGVVLSDIPDTTSGTVITIDGSLVSVQLETALTPTQGDPVYLSSAFAGRATNVAPSATSEIVLPIGVIANTTDYGAFDRVDIELRIGTFTVNA
jgi:hypothetical protein